MESSDPWKAEERPCRDPRCPGVAEPEVENDVRYWECQECGFEFGYERTQAADADCMVGIPEDVRRQVMSNVLADEDTLARNRAAFAARLKEQGKVPLNLVDVEHRTDKA